MFASDGLNVFLHSGGVGRVDAAGQLRLRNAKRNIDIERLRRPHTADADGKIHEAFSLRIQPVVQIHRADVVAVNPDGPAVVGKGFLLVLHAITALHIKLLKPPIPGWQAARYCRSKCQHRTFRFFRFSSCGAFLLLAGTSSAEAAPMQSHENAAEAKLLLRRVSYPVCKSGAGNHYYGRESLLPISGAKLYAEMATPFPRIVFTIRNLPEYRKFRFTDRILWFSAWERL